jgi:hypothetical protein
VHGARRLIIPTLLLRIARRTVAARPTMCLLGLLLGLHPEVPFVCAHNRDEYMVRNG